MRNTSRILVEFAQVLTSEYDEDKHLRCTLDLPGGDSCQPVEVISPLGFAARPLDPDDVSGGAPDGVSEVIQFTRGDVISVLPVNDPRVVTQLPALKKGGTISFCIASPRSYGFFAGLDPKKVDRAGSYTLSTGYGDGANAKAHFFNFDIREDGEESVTLKHGDGHGLMFTTGGKHSAVLVNKDGSAFVEVNDEGIVFSGKLKAQGSTTIGDMAAADAVPKMKALIAYMTVLEGKLAALGQSVPTPFASLEKAMGTSNFKAS